MLLRYRVRNLELSKDNVHEIRTGRRSEIAVVFALDGLEVHNHVADDACRFDRSVVRASLIGSTDKHSDRDLVDASQIDQGCLAFALIIVRRKLLEPISVGILPPMLLRLDRHRLAPVAIRVVASILAKLVANFGILCVPVVGPV